jgi:hypothetical protein
VHLSQALKKHGGFAVFAGFETFPKAFETVSTRPTGPRI